MILALIIISCYARLQIHNDDLFSSTMIPNLGLVILFVLAIIALKRLFRQTMVE